MSEYDHPQGTCGLFCPYCRVGVPRDLKAVRKYEQTFDLEGDVDKHPEWCKCQRVCEGDQ